MAAFNAFNKTIIDEFRANSGKVGGRFEGAAHAAARRRRARRAAQTRVNPLVYSPAGDRFLIFASKGGAPTHPAWYHNLLAHPSATIEVGTESSTSPRGSCRALNATRSGPRRRPPRPAFATYQRNTTRVIPVVELTRMD